MIRVDLPPVVGNLGSQNPGGPLVLSVGAPSGRLGEDALFAGATSLTPFNDRNMIHVRSVTKSYADLRRGRFVAVDSLSFDAWPGEIYGLLGPNGAGKTTMLRILSTVLQPTSGKASVNGFDVVTQPSHVRRQIGFVSTNTAVYDRMTAWEMVEYFGRLLRPVRRGAAAAHGGAFSAAADERDPRRAGGEDVDRHAAEGFDCPVLVHDPPVLVFDEATAGLDVLVARALLKIVAELREHGKCVVFSTHIMREAERLCDRIAILHRGHLLAEGSFAELADRYGETDLEEVFFRLISAHDERQTVVEGASLRRRGGVVERRNGCARSGTAVGPANRAGPGIANNGAGRCGRRP